MFFLPYSGSLLYLKRLLFGYVLEAVQAGRAGSSPSSTTPHRYPPNAHSTSQDPNPLHLVDSSALLWLLKLNGTNVGVERWLEVAESWCKYENLRQCSFTDLHTVMVYSELGGHGSSRSHPKLSIYSHSLTKLSLIASHGLDTWREKAEELIAPIVAEADTTLVYINLPNALIS